MRIVMVEGAACMDVMRASIQAALLMPESVFKQLRFALFLTKNLIGPVCLAA